LIKLKKTNILDPNASVSDKQNFSYFHDEI
jgi:hypothetical protein